jgi:hypothetical protein
MGAVSVVATVPDAPAASVPTLMFAIRDVVPPAASEMATATDWAVAVPRLLTVSVSGVVLPVLMVYVPSLSELGTTSAIGVGDVVEVVGLETPSVAVVVLFAVLDSGSGVVALAMTV